MTSTFPGSESDRTPRFVLDLAEQLDGEFDITVLAPHAPDLPVKQRLGRLEIVRFRYLPKRLEQLTAGGGIPDRLHSNPFNYLAIPFFLVAQILATIRQIRRLSPDAIHAHWWLPQGLSAVIATRLMRQSCTPIICTLHGADVFAFRGHLMRRVMTAVLRRCSRVCPVSETIREQIPNSMRRRSSTVTAPMGVDMERTFRPIPDTTPDYSSVLFVGRLAEKKGLEWLLTSFAAAFRRNNQLSLLIVGDGMLKNKLRQLAEDLGIDERVRFLGARPHADLPTLYATAGMTVVPSIRARSGDQEGFGLTAVEALACGCPVIASDTPSLTEIVCDGENRAIVRQNDQEALADAICDFSQNRELQRRYRLIARASVIQFDWTRAGKHYGQIINDCIVESGLGVSRNA